MEIPFLKLLGFLLKKLLPFTSLFKRALSAFTEQKGKKWEEPCQEVHFRLKGKNRNPIQCCDTAPIQRCLRESLNAQEVNQPQLDRDIDILMGCSHRVTLTMIWARSNQQLLIWVLDKGGTHIRKARATWQCDIFPTADMLQMITSVKIILWKQQDDLFTGKHTDF